MIDCAGWLLDLYSDPQSGVVLWLIGEDGQRYRLTQSFPITFYAAGPPGLLRSLWRFLKSHPYPVRLGRDERRDLFENELVTVMSIEVDSHDLQERLFRQVSQEFPGLSYYDADVPLALRHAARYETFPLAHCKVRAHAGGQVQAISRCDDSPWQLNPPAPPLRILTIEPDQDPRRSMPASLQLRYGRWESTLALEPVRPLLVNLAAVLRQYDPDIVLSRWGDGWLFPYLVEQAGRHHLPLPLNRDSGRTVLRKEEATYHSYGQVMHRDQQIHFFGRIHVDANNAMLFHDYGLDGIYELSRVTALPMQVAARNSPGAGISSMQMIVALRRGVLIPWHKQQAELPKTAWDLLHSDQGGLVYQPITGLHAHVAGLDFISMYPSIMVHCDISPETVPPRLEPRRQPLAAHSTFTAPAGSQPATLLPGMQDHVAAPLDLSSSLSDPASSISALLLDPSDDPTASIPDSLIPQTLAPLLQKRIAIKRQLNTLPRNDPRRKGFKARASAHKWLLVTCFGYLGYKNARFGRIEAHEAVTAYGREALLRAKEAAEDLEYEVLHLYVDGIWVRKDGPLQPADLDPLLDEVFRRTGLPIALDGIYRWVAFVPSRLNSSVPVANRYFGVFQDGTIKVRGIEARRRDAPVWIAEMQMEMLARLAHPEDLEGARRLVPEQVIRLRGCIRDLRAGRIPMDRLVVAQKLSRNVEDYRSPPPVARAALQLRAEGKIMGAGQVVRFLYAVGRPGVHAWDLSTPLDPARIDVERYATLLLRAAATILQPFGLDEAALHRQVFHPGLLPASTRPVQLPLWRRRSLDDA